MKDGTILIDVDKRHVKSGNISEMDFFKAIVMLECYATTRWKFSKDDIESAKSIAAAAILAE